MCRVILRALEGRKDVQKVRSMLQGFAKRGSGTMTTVKAKASLDSLGATLNVMDDEMQAVVCEAQAKVNGADADKAARSDAQAAAEESVIQLKQRVLDSKSTMEGNATSIDEAKAALAEAKRAEKSNRVGLRVAERTRGHIETAKREYSVLKDTQIEGHEGHKRLRSLRKVGKEFGFHEVMLNALPAVLAKLPDKRRTFDDLTIQHLQVEIDRNAGKAEAAVQDGGRCAAEQVAAVQRAREALASAKGLHVAHARAVSEAVAALDEAKATEHAARKHARAFEADLRQATRSLSRAMCCLSAFRSGPLAAYEALRAEVAALAAPMKLDVPTMADHKSEARGTTQGAAAAETDDGRPTGRCQLPSASDSTEAESGALG